MHLDLTDASEEDEEEEPEEVKGAWEELIIIQREQQRWEKMLPVGQTNLDEGREFFGCIELSLSMILWKIDVQHLKLLNYLKYLKQI